MVSSSSSNVSTEETWEPLMGPKLIGRERRRLMQFLRAYRSYFAFSMKELGAFFRPGIRIELASDTPIFRRPYRYNDMERALIRSRTLDLLKAKLVELLHGEYASTTVMPTKKDVHGNYMNMRMCGNYRPINRQTKFDKYAMPTPEEIFGVVGHARVFSTLDLRAGYHQLPIRKEDKANTAFWGVNSHDKDYLYQWKFIPFGLKNTPASFNM